MLHLIHEPPLHYTSLPGFRALNESLLAGFEREINGPHVRQSHYELGRYENTYIKRAAIPEIEPLCAAAMAGGREILGQNELKLGFWFNIMQPGDRTARHNHEEEDELLSCVYYLAAPENSGDLLLFTAAREIRMPPVEGRLVFFSPRLAHAVAENRSGARRVSIAFNFGQAESS